MNRMFLLNSLSSAALRPDHAEDTVEDTDMRKRLTQGMIDSYNNSSLESQELQALLPMIGQNTPHLTQALGRDYESRSPYPAKPMELDEDGSVVIPQPFGDDSFFREASEARDVFVNQIPEVQEELSGKPTNMTFEMGGHTWDRNDGGLSFNLDESLFGVSRLPGLAKGADVRSAVLGEMDDWMLRHDSYQAIVHTTQDVTLSSLPDDQIELVLIEILTINLAGSDKGGGQLASRILQSPINSRELLASATKSMNVSLDDLSLNEIFSGVSGEASEGENIERISLNIGRGQKIPGLREAIERTYTDEKRELTETINRGANSSLAIEMLKPKIEAELTSIDPNTQVTSAIEQATENMIEKDPDNPLFAGIHWAWNSMAGLVEDLGEDARGLVDWIKETEGYGRWQDLVGRVAAEEKEVQRAAALGVNPRTPMLSMRETLALNRSEFDVIMTKGMNKYMKDFKFEDLEQVQETIRHVLDNPKEYDIATQQALLMTYNGLFDTFKDRINDGYKATDRDIKFNRLFHNFTEWAAGRTTGESTDGTDMFSYLFNPDPASRKAFVEGDQRFLNLWAEAYDKATEIFREEVVALLPPLPEKASDEVRAERERTLEGYRTWSFLPTPADDWKHSGEKFNNMNPVSKVATIRAMHRIRTANPGGENQAYKDIVSNLRSDFALITSGLLKEGSDDPTLQQRAASALAVISSLTDSSMDYSDVYWNRELQEMLDLTSPQISMIKATINLMDREGVATPMSSYMLDPSNENATAMGRKMTDLHWHVINGLQNSLAGTVKPTILTGAQKNRLFSLGFRPQGEDETFADYIKRLGREVPRDESVGYEGSSRAAHELLTSALRDMGVSIGNPFADTLTDAERKDLVGAYNLLDSRGFLHTSDIHKYSMRSGNNMALMATLADHTVADTDTDKLLYAAVTNGFMDFYRLGGEDMVEVVGGAMAGLNAGVEAFVLMGTAADLQGTNPHGIWRDNEGNTLLLPRNMPASALQDIHRDPNRNRNVEFLATYTYPNKTLDMQHMFGDEFRTEADHIMRSMGSVTARNTMRAGLNVTDERLRTEIEAVLRDFKRAHAEGGASVRNAIRVTPASVAMNAIVRLHNENSVYVTRQGTSESGARFGMMGEHTLGGMTPNKEFADLGLKLYSVGMELVADLPPALRSQRMGPESYHVRLNTLTKGPNNEPRHEAFFGNMVFEWEHKPFNTNSEAPSAWRYDHTQFTAEQGHVPWQPAMDPKRQQEMIEQQRIEAGHSRAEVGQASAADPINPARDPGGTINKPSE